MEENKLAQQTPLTQAEQILRLARQLSRDQEEVCTEKEFQYGRRRDMFERVALAVISNRRPFSIEYLHETASMLLEQSDKFAKGE